MRGSGCSRLRLATAAEGPSRGGFMLVNSVKENLVGVKGWYQSSMPASSLMIWLLHAAAIGLEWTGFLSFWRAVS